MPSSTSGSRRIFALLLAATFAAVPPFVGLQILPPATEGAPIPGLRAKRMPLTEPHPDIVVIGNSKAHSDIDKGMLASSLGIPDLRLEVISLGSATLPVYFVVIKNKVLPQWHPSAIVVYATPVEILAADLTPDRRNLLIVPYLNADEPVIARKLYHRTPSGLAGLYERAVTARDGTLSVFAATVARQIGGGRGRDALDTSFETVFGQSFATRTGTDMTGVPAGGYPSESAMGKALEDTFVLETEAVCKEAGVPIVYAVAPVNGGVKEREERRLRGQEPVLADAAAHSDLWIKIPYPGEGPTFWSDNEHMTKSGALLTTQTIGNALRESGLIRRE